MFITKENEKKYNSLNFEIQEKKKDNSFLFVFVGSLGQREKIAIIFH